MTRILITGVSGLIGGMLARHLKEQGGYQITALNRSPVKDFDSVQADISDLESIKPAFKNQDVVVHMSAFAQNSFMPGSKFSGTLEEEWAGHLSANIIGVYNVYEAARQSGVKRVIFGSSGAAIGGFEKIEPYKAIAEGRYETVAPDYTKITHEQFRPFGIYGATKVWGEAIGRHFSDEYGISVLCLRIGSVRSDDWPDNPRRSSYYFSHRDILQMLVKCIHAPQDLKFDIFMAASDNKWTYYDLEHTKKVLGYVPQDKSEDFE